MRLPILAIAVGTLFATTALADPIEDRQAIMKERGQIMRTLGPIAQGQQPFDAATVLDALERMNANAQKTDIAALFPEGSDSGDTKAAPAIWEDMAGFTEISDKFKADAAAALEAAPQDLEAFRAVFAPMASNCGSCHERFRLD
ncbi:MAG: c-type cytochrome [Aliihoeflea sp.]